MSNEKDKFKKALQESVSAWDADGVWDNIEKSLPEEKNKRRILWWIFGLTLPLIVVSSLCYTIYDRPTGLRHTDKNKVTQSQDRNVNIIDQDTITKADKAIKRVDTDEVESKTVAIDNLRALVGSYYNDKVFRPTDAIVHSTSLSNDDRPTAEPSSQKRTPFFGNKSEPIYYHLDKIDSLPLLRSYILFHRESIFSNNYIEFFYPQKSTLPLASFAIVGGVHSTDRKLLSNNQVWLAAKDSGEELKETLDFQLLYKRFVSSHLYFETGIGFIQTVEILETSDTEVVSTRQVYSDSAYVYQDNYIGGTTVESLQQEVTVRTPNRFQSLFIPISVGRRFLLDNSVLHLDIGTELRFITRNTGRGLGFDQGVNDLMHNDDYRSSIGISSLVVGAAWEVPISKRFSGLIGLQYRYGLWDYFNTDAANLHYQNFGLNVGVRYRIRS